MPSNRAVTYAGRGEVRVTVMTNHRALMHSNQRDGVQTAKAVNAAVITPDDAPAGYAEFDSGASQKFVIDSPDVIAA